MSMLAAACTAGCQSYTPDYSLVQLVDNGQHALASERILESLPTGPNAQRDLDYGLASIRLGMAQLADGQVDAAETPLLAVYEVLRTQGINDGRGMLIFLQDEDRLTYWKGEPFEQAMAYAYFSAQLASVGDWYNAVVAADNAIFQLANFERTVGDNNSEPQTSPSTVDAQSVFTAAERASTADSETSFDDVLGSGYVPEQTNFVVGYMMQGIAAIEAGNAVEDRFKARDAFARAVQYNPALEPLTTAILNGAVNTIFWVDFGKGPAKERYGHADAFAGFRPLMRGSGRLSLDVTHPDSSAPQQVTAFPVAADINEYALDHRWLNLQNLRLTKAALGDALIAGGTIVATSSDSTEAAIAGAAMVLAGWLQRQGARADIRHVEIMPQRVYFAGAHIDQPNTTVRFRIDDQPGATLVLPGINPPPDQHRTQFRYVRLNNPASNTPPAWATSGVVRYANDNYSKRIPGDTLPFIMGGTCVRAPSPETIRRYHEGGNLLDLTLTDLENIYRGEGITWELGDQRGVAFRHVLEGGTSLIPPIEGSTGFARLFCQTHPPYTPRGELLRRYLERTQPASLEPPANRNRR